MLERGILDPEADAPKVLASVKGHGGLRFASFLEDRAFVVENVGGPTVYACANDILKKIAVSRAEVEFGFERQRQLFFTAHGDWYEWVGLADGVDRFLSKQKT